MEQSDVLKAPPDSTNSDLASNVQDVADNDSVSAAQSNNSVSTSPSVSKSIPFRDPYLPEDDGSILTPEHAFVQYQTRSEDQACQICGQPAVGFHHRAYVCEACKKFFMRHTAARYRNSEAGGPSPAESVCPLGGQCRVEGPGRGKCPHCRYRKCLDLGMTLTPPGGESGCDISQIPCRVCGGPSSGFHFGALTCEGCKGFFRRTVLSSVQLECLSNNDCPITPANRNMCKSCRFQRCLAVGMSKSGSRIGRQPNAIKYYCAREISQLSSTGEADSAPSSSSVPLSNGRGSNMNRPRTSSVSSSEGDKVRSPVPLPRIATPWTSADQTVQPVQSSTDHGSSTSSSGTFNGQSFIGLSNSSKSNTNNNINNQGILFSSMRRFSTENPHGNPPPETRGKPVTLGNAGTKKRKSIGLSQQQSHHSVDSTGLAVSTPGSLDADRDRLKYSPTQAVAFSEAHSSSSSLSPGTRGIHDLSQSRGSRNWYTPFSQASSDGGVYDRGLRLGVVSMGTLSHAPTLEYSLPNPDMSSHISSTTTSLHEMRSPCAELEDETDDVPQEENGKMLTSLAVHLPMDESSEDLLIGYSKPFNTTQVLPRREPSSTFTYSPSLGKEPASGLYPFSTRSAVPDQSPPPPRHGLLSSATDSGQQSVMRLPSMDDDVPQAQGALSASSRSARSIVDHLTSTVLQFRQHHQRISSAASDTPVGSSKLSGSPPLDIGPSQQIQRLSELPPGSHSDENEGRYPAPSASPSAQPIPPTRTPILSGHQTYPLPSSCKPASPEFVWHSQSSQQQHQQQQQSYPQLKQRYVKTNGSPSSLLDSAPQFRTPGAHASKYCDQVPRSLNGNPDHSPAVTAALCAAAAEVTSSTSSTAPWFAAAAAAAAMANVLMVASQAPTSSSNTGSFTDAYAIQSSDNGCSTEIAGCRRGGSPTASSFSKRLKVSGSESPLMVNSSGPPISSVSQHQLEQYVGNLSKCDASTVFRSFQLPSQGIDSQANSRLTHPSAVAAVHAAAAAAAAAAATAAGLVLSNSGVRPLPDELAQMHRNTAAALTSFSDLPNSYDNSTTSSSPSPPSSQQQHVFGRIPCSLSEVPLMYSSLEPRPTVNLTASRKDLNPIEPSENGAGALFITVQEFATGIQRATKYMISERKNIRSRVKPSPQPMQSLERIEDVWDRMMQHFEHHSRFIVTFVKMIPGFNQLKLVDKRQLVRGAMYPLMLLELSRDYVNGESSQYNYFDFTESEREVILKHFPTFHTITGHLIRSGEFLHQVRLDNIELTLVCAQEVFKNQQGLIDAASTAHLFNLASRVLANHLIESGQPVEERTNLLRLLSPLLDKLNMEHHQVIAQLRQEKPQLDFPELYTEMFQLSEADEREQREHAALMQSTESSS